MPCVMKCRRTPVRIAIHRMSMHMVIIIATLVQKGAMVPEND